MKPTAKKKERTAIYHITPGYRRLNIWECDAKTGQRICRTAIIPNPSLARPYRYSAICKRLSDLGIPCPVYVPTKAEAPMPNPSRPRKKKDTAAKEKNL